MGLNISKLYCKCGTPVVRSVRRDGLSYRSNYFDPLDTTEDPLPILLCTECAADLAVLDATGRLSSRPGQAAGAQR